MSLNTNGARAGAASSVRLGERLVKVEMDSVKTHQSGRCDTENGVKVRSIVVHLATRLVNDSARFGNIGFKQTKRVWIGDHHRCSCFISHSRKCGQVHSAVDETWDFHDFKTCHRGAGWVGPMGRIGNDDLGALIFTAQPEVFLNAANGREFTLCASHGLQGHVVHSSNDTKHVLHLVVYREQSLKLVFGLMWMDVGDAGKLSDDFVHAGIVFHRARAKRIESGINTKVALGEPSVMSHHFGFRKSGPSGGMLTNKTLRDRRGRCGFKGRWLTVSGAFCTVVAEQVAQALTSACVDQTAS